MTTTRTVVLRGLDRGFSLEEIRPAGLRPDEVLMEIAGAGMCHTDMLPRTPEMGTRPAPMCWDTREAVW
jgi:aryl-alcohol dehydrogenase